MASKNTFSDDVFDKLWTHKYAPKNVEEIVLNKNVREMVNEYIADKDFPTLLFCGRPGQGKTTLANLLCKEFPTSVLFINASLDNGMDTIRGKIMSFSETMSSFGELKVVILDEADRLSNQAQDALRGIIENNASHTRFILTANERSRLTDAIQSRCTFVNIQPTKSGFVNYIIRILEKEHIKISKETMPKLKQVLDTHFPDLRKTINIIQCACRDGELKLESSCLDGSFAADLIREIDLKADIIEIRKSWLDRESEFQADYRFILRKLHECYYKKNDLSSIQRAKVILEIADGLRDSNNAIDQELNFYAVIIRIYRSLYPEMEI